MKVHATTPYLHILLGQHLIYSANELTPRVKQEQFGPL